MKTTLGLRPQGFPTAPEGKGHAEGTVVLPSRSIRSPYGQESLYFADSDGSAGYAD
ncbi:hypothetical protein [Paenibacillus riograndensis]|uniref:hypothetical protein n=1 Tax=Paenibacillus riograndensis TaxID=483937 RepID=UPI0002F32120|nr:hypothetical protein [Paenibacillus riograndensis]